MSETILDIQKLGRRFGGLVAVDDLSFTVGKGEIVSLIGPNGAGKTTVFNVITGIHPASSGTMRFGEHSLDKLAPHQVSRLGVARTFQNMRVFSNLTVIENVMVGFTTSNRASLLHSILGVPISKREEKRIRNQAASLCEMLNLSRVSDQLVRYLPYGEQRRVEIARGLATNPSLMMLDEPAAGISHGEISELNALIRRMRDEMGKTILLVEHHMNVVLDISDRVIVLDHGRKISEGTPLEIKRDPRVIDAYLGSATVE